MAEIDDENIVNEDNQYSRVDDTTTEPPFNFSLDQYLSDLKPNPVTTVEEVTVTKDMGLSPYMRTYLNNVQSGAKKAMLNADFSYLGGYFDQRYEAALRAVDQNIQELNISEQDKANIYKDQKTIDQYVKVYNNFRDSGGDINNFVLFAKNYDPVVGDPNVIEHYTDPKLKQKFDKRLKKKYTDKNYLTYNKAFVNNLPNELDVNTLNNHFKGTDIYFDMDNGELRANYGDQSTKELQAAPNSIFQGAVEFFTGKESLGMNSLVVDPYNPIQLSKWIQNTLLTAEEEKKISVSNTEEKKNNYYKLQLSRPEKFQSSQINTKAIENYVVKQKEQVVSLAKSLESDKNEFDKLQGTETIIKYNNLEKEYTELNDKLTEIKKNLEGKTNPSEKDINDYNLQVENLNKIYQSIEEIQKTDEFSYYSELNKSLVKNSEELVKLNENAKTIEEQNKVVIAKQYIEKEKTGSFVGNIASGLYTGLLETAESSVVLAFDAAVGSGLIKVDDLFGPSYAKDLGKSDTQKYNEFKRELSNVFDNEITNRFTEAVYGTTEEYAQSDKRSDLEKSARMVSEAIGAMAGGGGNAPLTLFGFFSQSYNAINKEMKGGEFDDLTSFEKNILAVPVSIAVGYLDKLGAKISLGDPLMKNLLLKTLAKSITEIPKDATLEYVESAIKKNISTQIALGTLKIVGSSLAEGFTEGAQEVATMSAKAIFNEYHKKDLFNLPDITTKEGREEAKNIVLENIYYGTIGGTIMSSGEQAVSAVKNGFDNSKADAKFDLLYNTITDPELILTVKNAIKLDLANQKITRETAEQRMESVNSVYSLFQSIPKDLSTGQKKEAFNLINEKKRLEQEIEGKDPSLVDAQKKRVSEINESLKTISNNAAKETTNKQQAVTAEGGVSEYQGASEGQQEVGQVEGGQREATVNETDSGNSTIPSKVQEEVSSEVKEPDNYAKAVDDYKSTELGSSEDAKNKKAKLVEESETKEGKAFVKNKVQKLDRNEDGTITVYRSGTLQEGHNPTTTNKQTAEIIAEERKKQGLSSDIIEVRVNESDISVVVPGIESEVFIKVDENNKNRLNNNTKKDTKTKGQLESEKDSVKNELEKTKQQLEKAKKDKEDGTFTFSDNTYNDIVKKQEQKIKNLEWQLKKYDAELAALGTTQKSDQVATLRAEEQAELLEVIPKIENYKVNGEIDKTLMPKTVLDKYNKVYNKYDKLISPLLETTGEITINKPAIATNTTAEVSRVKSLNEVDEDGATFNIDGVKYEGPGLVVPVISMNTTMEELTPEMISNFVEEHSDKIGDSETVKVGIYKFPNSNQVSIDLNILAPESSRGQAIEFGRLSGQESLFDMSTFENVKTGATGENPMQFTPNQFKEIAKALKEGRMPNVFGTQATTSKKTDYKQNLVTPENARDVASKQNTPLKQKIAKTAAMIMRALPGVKIYLHNNKSEMHQALANSTGKSLDKVSKEVGNSRGSQVEGEIHINMEIATATTLLHEAFHEAILRSGKSIKTIIDFANGLKNIISDKDVKAKLDKFVAMYEMEANDREEAIELENKKRIADGGVAMNEKESDNYIASLEEATKSDEFLTELGAIMAEAETELTTTKFQKFLNLINRIAKSLGLPVIIKSSATAQEAVDFINSMSKSLRTGEAIEGDNKGDGKIKKQAEKLFLEETPKFKSLDDVSKYIQSWVNENKLFDKSIEDVSDQEVVNKFAEHVLNEIRAWESIKGSEYVGFYNEDIPQRLNPELQKFAKQRYGRELTGEEVSLYHMVSAFASPSADPHFDSSKGLEVFDKYMMTGDLTAYGTDQATIWDTDSKGKRYDTGKLKFDDKGNPVYKQVAKAYATTSLEKFNNIVNNFNGDISKAVNWVLSNHSFDDASKMMGKPITGAKANQLDENEYFTKENGGTGVFAITGAKLGSYILNRVGDYSTVTKDMWYARTLARLAGESLTEKGKAIKSPWASNTKQGLRKRKLADKAFEIVAKELGTSPADVQQKIWDFEKRLYEKLGAVEKSSYASEGLKSKAKQILSEQPSKIKQQKGITPENSSNYANLTEDDKGNFVFFHVGKNNYDVIKRSSGGTLVTSKEESRAIGKVGGLAMYYTSPESGESMVTGPSKYVVSVSPDKVYDFDSDPDNIIEEAKKRFNKEYPGQAFDTNTQLAYVTKIASEKGYDMTVAQWEDGTRAQTALELKPNDVQLSDGNTIVKQFEETYESNRKKGYKSVIPKSKYQRIKKLFDKINTERNKTSTYDALYRLAGEENKYSDSELSNLIMNSDISIEIKNEFQDILNYKPESRKSIKQQKTAPNGKPSKLDDVQWEQVRTPAFKKWFGDWENDPKNASKVVDENGEPMPVYHGTSSENKSDIEKSGFDSYKGRNGLVGFSFMSDIKLVEPYNKGAIIDVFLNLKNPMDYDTNFKIRSEILKDLGKTFKTMTTSDWIKYTEYISKEFVNKAAKLGYDGVFQSNQSEINVFKNTNIKIADGTNTTFDATQPSIKLQKTPQETRMDKESEDVFKKSLDRGTTWPKATQNALDYIQKSKWYQDATDVEREQKVRDFKESKKQKLKKAPSVAKILGTPKPKMVTVNEAAAFKDQLRLEAKAAREARGDLNFKRKSLSDAIKGMVKLGKLKTTQAVTIITRVSKVNLDSSVQVERLIEYASRVFERADYQERLDRAFSYRRAIKKLLKTDNQAQVVGMANEFTKLDPSMVENIDEYIDIAEKVKNAVAPSKAKPFILDKENYFDTDTAKGFDMILKQATNIEAVSKFVKDELEKQEERLQYELLSTNYDLFESGVLSPDMTAKQMKEIVDAIKKDPAYKINSKENEKYMMAYLLKRFESLAGTVSDIIKTNQNPVTGERVAIDQKDVAIISDLLKVDLSEMGVRDALFIVEAMDNFITNGITSKLEGALSAYKGQIGLKEEIKSGKVARPLKLYFSKVLGRTFANEFTPLTLMIERMFNGVKSGISVMKSMGLSIVINGVNKANYLHNKIIDEYYNKFIRKSKTFHTPENVYERGMLAFLKRNVTGSLEEMKAETNRRVKMIEQSITTLKNKGDKSQKAMAEIYQKVFDKLDVSTGDIDVIESRASKENKDAVNWWINQWSKHYKDLADISLSVYNYDLGSDLNYTPDKYKLIKTEEFDQKLIERNSSFLISMDNYTDKEKTGVLMQSIRPNAMEEGRYLSFDFDANNSNSLKGALVDINTAAGIRQVDGFLNSKLLDKLIPSTEDRDALVKRVNRYIRRSKGKVFVPKDLYKYADDALNFAARLGVSKALGGVLQSVKQTIPIAISTAIMTGKFNIPSVSFNEWLNKTGMPTANRGLDSLSAIESIDRRLDAKGTMFKNSLKWVQKTQQLYLNWFLSKPDVMIARTAFQSYYLQYMGKSSIDWDNHTPNQDALNYAEAMVGRQQNINDPMLGGEFLTAEDSMKRMYKKVLLPFASFGLNQKARLNSDLINIGSKTTSFEDRKIALKSVTATIAEMAAYRAISVGIGYGFYKAAEAIIKNYVGDDEDDDDDKERDKKWFLSSVKFPLKSMINDLVSPLPLLDEYVTMGADYILSLNTGYTEAELDELVKQENEIRGLKDLDPLEGRQLKKFREEKKEESLYQLAGKYESSKFGMGSIYYDAAKKFYNEYQLGMTGEFKDEYRGNITTKKIRPVEQEVIKNSLIFSALYMLDLLPKEADQMTTKVVNMIKKNAMSESEYEKYEGFKKEYKREPGYLEMALIRSDKKQDYIEKELNFIKDEGGLSLVQAKEYVKVFNLINEVTPYDLSKIKEGQTADQIIKSLKKEYKERISEVQTETEGDGREVFQPIETKEEAEEVFQPIETKEETEGVFQPIETEEETEGVFQPIETEEENSEVFQPIK